MIFLTMIIILIFLGDNPDGNPDNHDDHINPDDNQVCEVEHQWSWSDNHNHDNHQGYQDYLHNDPGDIDHYTDDDQDCEVAQQWSRF